MMASTQAEFWTSYEFPKRATLTFSSSDSFVIFCPDWPEPETLESDLSGSNHWYDPDAECTILLQEDDSKVDITMATARRLCAQWGLPASCGELLFSSRSGKGMYSEPVGSGSVLCVWYVIPVILSHPDGGRLSEINLRACHILDTHAYRSRSVVICPLDLHMDISEVFRAQLTGNGRAMSQFIWPGWFSTHLLITQAALNGLTTSVQSIAWVTIGVESAARRSAAGDALGTTALLPCDNILETMHDWERSCSSMKDVVTQLHALSTGVLTDTEIISASLQNLLNNIECELEMLNKFKYGAVRARKHLMESMKLRNAAYMRQNTIQLRRMVEQTRTEAEQTKKHADSSARQASIATRIALVTLIYLPPTFIATVFSTPFLQLDDNMQFSAISGIWIYFFISLALTVLTLVFYFSASWLAALFSWIRGRQTNIEQPSALEGEGTSPEDADRIFLEPQPFQEPSAEETLADLVAMVNDPVRRKLGKRLLEEDDAEDIGLSVDEMAIGVSTSREN